jgi:hypothetical protein
MRAAFRFSNTASWFSDWTVAPDSTLLPFQGHQ